MQKRLHEIDGIRGWASLIVLVFHLTWELFGSMFPIYRPSYLKFFFDGSLAVYVFFVLSGDALSNAYILNKNQKSLAKLVMKRYFRLAGPIFLSCLAAYFLLKLDWAYHVPAAQIVGRSDWLGASLPFDASFVAMVKYSLLKVFTDHTIQNSYNPFLWPMSIELYGSFFVFGMLFSMHHLKKPIAVVAIAAGYLWILGSFYSLFFIGLGFSMMRANGAFEAIKNSRVTKLSFPGLLMVIILDAALEKAGVKISQISILMAALVVFFAYSNKNLISFFSNKLSRFLGRISFPLYLCQFFVMISFTSWMILYLKERGLLNAWYSLGIVICSIFVATVVAELFARIETIYLGKLDVVARNLLNDRDGGVSFARQTGNDTLLTTISKE
jgi:peptidoglycan/LPS O-acetylase OafA/YrhL